MRENLYREREEKKIKRKKEEEFSLQVIKEESSVGESDDDQEKNCKRKEAGDKGAQYQESEEPQHTELLQIQLKPC